jgi:tetratricopeptide (TPR) repeat protein
MAAFAYASWNAWALGRTEIARQREALMMALVNQDDAYDLAYSGALAARLRLYMREYQQAEMLAGQAVQLSEHNQFPYLIGLCRCLLGRARADLGRHSDAIGLIRKGISQLLEIGTYWGITSHMEYLAEA